MTNEERCNLRSLVRRYAAVKPRGNGWTPAPLKAEISREEIMKEIVSFVETIENEKGSRA